MKEFDYVIDLGLEWPEGRSKRQRTDAIVIHHTVGNYGTPDRWRRLHQSRVDSPTHRGVSYNYLVKENGEIYIGRGLEYEGGSVRNDRTNDLNSRCVAIAFNGDLRNGVTDAALAAAKRLCNDILKVYPEIKNIWGHNEVPVFEGSHPTGALYPTLCPCLDMDMFRRYLKDEQQDEPPIANIGMYVVKASDTLYQIAKRILGNGSRYPEIMELNALMGTQISVGQELLIPDDTPEEPAEPPEEKEILPADHYYAGDTYVNIRESPISGNVIGELRKGENCIVLTKKDGWAEILKSHRDGTYARGYCIVTGLSRGMMLK